MILFLLAGLSLSTIYFIRLFYKNNMKNASALTAVLYTYCVLYLYAIFVFDSLNLGFTGSETGLSLLHGSDTYHSFVKLTEKMAIMPLPLLKATVYIAVLVLLCSIMVCCHGILEISREVIRLVKRSAYNHYRANKKSKESIRRVSIIRIPLIRLYCRANC